MVYATGDELRVVGARGGVLAALLVVADLLRRLAVRRRDGAADRDLVHAAVLGLVTELAVDNAAGAWLEAEERRVDQRLPAATLLSPSDYCTAQQLREVSLTRKAFVLVLLYSLTSTLPPARSDELNLTVSLLPDTAQPEI